MKTEIRACVWDESERTFPRKARWIKIYVFKWHILWNISEIYCAFFFSLLFFYKGISFYSFKWRRICWDSQYHTISHNGEKSGKFTLLCYLFIKYTSWHHTEVKRAKTEISDFIFFLPILSTFVVFFSNLPSLPFRIYKKIISTLLRTVAIYPLIF